jgi:Protein of unknown function (DUF2568)
VRETGAVPVLRAANLALKFLLELAAFAALAYWGATTGGGAASILLAVAAPAVAVALWAVFAAPRSERRLGEAVRIPFEIAVFAVAVVALVAAGAPVAALLLAALVLLNAALLTVLGQWES